MEVYTARLARHLDTLRRPETTDSAKFWYISLPKWDEHKQAALAAAGTKQEKSAMNNLRKFEAAGLIMETEEGKPAPNPCSWCTRSGTLDICRVFRDKDDKACAYCKRMGKSGCTAAVVREQTNEERLEQKVDELEEKLMGAEARMECLEEEVAKLKAQLAEFISHL